MKRLIILVFIVTFLSCSKDDGAIPDRVNIEDVPVITTNLESGGTTATIAFNNQGAFEGKIKVALYFTDAIAPAKVDIVVRKNGVASSVKLYKADVSSLPANYSIKAADLATLFEKPLAVNDTYDFAPDIYVGNKKYDAFPLTGAGNGSGVQGMSAVGFGEYVRFTVK
ncbi:MULTISPECIES: hypothetical protein [Niastella]|uniref:Uncharacterized protein n=1 Tax=Niastella soli TaxID=2821487 RepID=A0ABS3YRT3_9BACT|nr:hypothetical protein [Niastella soli]MBO9200568.1 hypothetical protein [Niastella soli]